jgi:flagellar hook-basal body complex protein FliE
MADELTIQQLRSLIESTGPARPAELRPAAAPGAEGAPGAPSFSEMLKSSIAEINDLKVQADKAVEELATGKTTDIQGTILALRKADLSFRLMMEVRNKIVSAYQEVMRMQV